MQPCAPICMAEPMRYLRLYFLLFLVPLPGHVEVYKWLLEVFDCWPSRGQIGG